MTVKQAKINQYSKQKPSCMNQVCLPCRVFIQLLQVSHCLTIRIRCELHCKTLVQHTEYRGINAYFNEIIICIHNTFLADPLWYCLEVFTVGQGVCLHRSYLSWGLKIRNKNSNYYNNRKEISRKTTVPVKQSVDRVSFLSTHMLFTLFSTHWMKNKFFWISTI